LSCGMFFYHINIFKILILLNIFTKKIFLNKNKEFKIQILKKAIRYFQLKVILLPFSIYAIFHIE
ncbi:hypothetical protein, partial [Staphylococcus epidermidis]